MKRLFFQLLILAAILTVTSPVPPARSLASEAPPSKPAQAPATAAEGQSLWLSKEGAAKLPEGKIALTRMTIEADLLEMVFSNSFYYEIHVESKPSRLEIDIHGAVNGLDVESVTVNKMGIATIRFENHPDFLRFVLYSAAGYPLPSRIDVTNNFRGLLIHAVPPEKKK